MKTQFTIEEYINKNMEIDNATSIVIKLINKI